MEKNLCITLVIYQEALSPHTAIYPVLRHALFHNKNQDYVFYSLNWRPFLSTTTTSTMGHNPASLPVDDWATCS